MLFCRPSEKDKSLIFHKAITILLAKGALWDYLLLLGAKIFFNHILPWRLQNNLLWWGHFHRLWLLHWILTETWLQQCCLCVRGEGLTERIILQKSEFFSAQFKFSSADRLTNYFINCLYLTLVSRLGRRLME